MLYVLLIHVVFPLSSAWTISLVFPLFLFGLSPSSFLFLLFGLSPSSFLFFLFGLSSSSFLFFFCLDYLLLLSSLFCLDYLPYEYYIHIYEVCLIYHVHSVDWFMLLSCVYLPWQTSIFLIRIDEGHSSVFSGRARQHK